MKKICLINQIISFLCLKLSAQPPSNVGCMLNEGGKINMYYGTNYKSTQGATYRYVYKTNTPYSYSAGVSCPAGGQYFQFSGFYTENGVPIGCRRTADFSGPLGEMRYFTVFSCPIDGDIFYAIPFSIGIGIIIAHSKPRNRSLDLV